MSKLTKNEIQEHTKVLKLLERGNLSVDEKLFVFENYREDAYHINSQSGAFFTPYGLARDLTLHAEYEDLDDLDEKDDKISFPNDKIEMELPDGSTLIAEPNNDANYPGIQISLKRAGADDSAETMCFVEYNPEQEKGEELCVCVYKQNQDEPKYYTNYRDINED